MFEALAFMNAKGMFWLQTIREDAALFADTSEP